MLKQCRDCGRVRTGNDAIKRCSKFGMFIEDCGSKMPNLKIDFVKEGTAVFPDRLKFDNGHYGVVTGVSKQEPQDTWITFRLSKEEVLKLRHKIKTKRLNKQHELSWVLGFKILKKIKQQVVNTIDGDENDQT